MNAISRTDLSICVYLYLVSSVAHIDLLLSTTYLSLLKLLISAFGGCKCLPCLHNSVVYIYGACFHFNPIALKKAKIAFLSANRVKLL